MHCKKISTPNELPKYLHHKNQKTMSIPCSAQNKYISSLLEKNDKFIEISKNEQEFTSCCKKVTSNLGNIFGSEVRKEAAINLVKRFRNTKSPFQNHEVSRLDYGGKCSHKKIGTVMPSPSINLRESPLLFKTEKKGIIEKGNPYEERLLQSNQGRARNCHLSQYDFAGFLENNKNEQQKSQKQTAFEIESCLFSGNNSKPERFQNASPFRNMSPMDKDFKNFFGSPIQSMPIDYALKQESNVRIMIKGKDNTKGRMLQRKKIVLEDFTKEIMENFSLVSNIKKEQQKLIDEDANSLMLTKDSKKKKVKAFKEDRNQESSLSKRKMFEVNDLVLEKNAFTLKGIKSLKVFNKVSKQSKDTFSMLKTKKPEEKTIFRKEKNAFSFIGIKQEPLPQPKIKRAFSKMIKEEKDTFSMLRDNSIKISKDLIAEVNSFSFNGKALNIIRKISNQDKATFSVIRNASVKDKKDLIKENNCFSVNGLQAIKVFNTINQENKDTFTVLRIEPPIKKKKKLEKEDNAFSLNALQSVKVFNKISKQKKDAFTVLSNKVPLKEKHQLKQEKNNFSLEALQLIKVFTKVRQEHKDTFSVLRIEPIIKEKNHLVQEKSNFSFNALQVIKIFNKVKQEDKDTFTVLGIKPSIEEKKDLIQENNGFDLIAIESKFTKQKFTEISQDSNDTFSVLRTEPSIIIKKEFIQETNTLELISPNIQKIFSKITKEQNALFFFEGIQPESIEEIILQRPFSQLMFYSKIIYQEHHITQIKLIQSKYKDYIINKKCKMLNEEITGFNINLLYKGRPYQRISLSINLSLKEINEQLKQFSMFSKISNENYTLLYNKTSKDQYNIVSNDTFYISNSIISKPDIIKPKPFEMTSQIQDLYFAPRENTKADISKKYILAKEITSCILSSVQKDANKQSNDKPKKITFADSETSSLVSIKDKSIKKSKTMNIKKEISPNISARIDEIMKERARLCGKEFLIDIEEDDHIIKKTKTTISDFDPTITEEKDDEVNYIKKTKTNAVMRNQNQLINNFLMENDRVIQSLQSKPVMKNKKKPNLRRFDEDFTQEKEIDEMVLKKATNSQSKRAALRKGLQSKRDIKNQKEH